MAPPSRRSPLVLLAAATLAVALGTLPVACGSDDASDSAQDQVAAAEDDTDSDGATEGGAATEEPADDAATADDAVEMTDVATGASTTLEAALDSPDGSPVLAWFWAPFCPTCRGEAPELDAFMADNGGRVKMVGIGTRDDLSEAEGFLEDTGVQNFPLLWEPTGQSWVDSAVSAQPYMLLMSDGEEVERWPGGASVRQIEDALAELGV